VLAALLVSLAGFGCRSAEPAPKPPERSPEQEARELVERARREVEAENVSPPVGSASGAALHAPPGGTRLPLLVFLHGLGGSGAELIEHLSLDAMAAASKFAFIAPEGKLDHSGRRFWNASDSCCNFEGLEVDHIGALQRWIGAAIGDRRVDPDRVYLVGFSNGGFLAYRAACELSPLIRGIFSIAGAGPHDTSACRPQKPLSVVQIHGDADPIVKFDGGYLFADRRRPRHPSAEKSLSYWAKFNACSGEPGVLGQLDLDPGIPGAETEVKQYPGCSGQSRVELWRIPGGNHTVGLSRLSVQAIVDFIAADAAP
jgi:polyhydroxybutyrate depolymerase